MDREKINRDDPAWRIIKRHCEEQIKRLLSELETGASSLEQVHLARGELRAVREILRLGPDADETPIADEGDDGLTGEFI